MRKKTYSLKLWTNSKKQQLGKKEWDRATANGYEQHQIPEPAKYDPIPTCSTLKLSAFIKITITGDLSHLGNLEDPQQVWADIHSEYTELSQDTQSSRALELAKQIAYYTNRIAITNLCVEHLNARGYIADVCEVLRQMGYRLQYSEFGLKRDLERTLSLSKSDLIKLTHAREQYDKLIADSEKGGKTNEFDWYRMLSALAKHRQVTVISPDSITVTEYIAMDRDFREYIAAMKAVSK